MVPILGLLLIVACASPLHTTTSLAESAGAEKRFERLRVDGLLGEIIGEVSR